MEGYKRPNPFNYFKVSVHKKIRASNFFAKTYLNFNYRLKLNM